MAAASRKVDFARASRFDQLLQAHHPPATQATLTKALNAVYLASRETCPTDEAQADAARRLLPVLHALLLHPTVTESRWHLLLREALSREPPCNMWLRATLAVFSEQLRLQGCVDQVAATRIQARWRGVLDRRDVGHACAFGLPRQAWIDALALHVRVLTYGALRNIVDIARTNIPPVEKRELLGRETCRVGPVLAPLSIDSTRFAKTVTDILDALIDAEEENVAKVNTALDILANVEAEDAVENAAATTLQARWRSRAVGAVVVGRGQFLHEGTERPATFYLGGGPLPRKSVPTLGTEAAAEAAAEARAQERQRAREEAVRAKRLKKERRRARAAAAQAAQAAAAQAAAAEVAQRAREKNAQREAELEARERADLERAIRASEAERAEAEAEAEAARLAAEEAEAATPQNDDKLCVICLDAEKTEVCIPCGHRTVCSTCAASARLRSCPICMAAVTLVVFMERVFE